MEEANQELARIRAMCYRLKKGNNDTQISFLLGVSITNSAYVGMMGYEKPKNRGGKKVFITPERVTKIDKDSGIKYKALPPINIAPHIHIMVNGLGASNYSQKIIDDLRIKNPGFKFRKKHLQSDAEIAMRESYIKNQSTVLRRV